MNVRRYLRTPEGKVILDDDGDATKDGTLLWVDVKVAPSATSVASLLEEFAFDAMALHDAANEPDLPKLDDFGDHVLLVLHGFVDDLSTVPDLGDPDLLSVEVDCFLTEDTLVTIRRGDSPGIEAFGRQIQRRKALATGGAGEILGRLAAAEPDDCRGQRTDTIVARSGHGSPGLCF